MLIEFIAVGAGSLLVLLLTARQLAHRARRRRFTVTEIPNFLSAEECEHLIALAEPDLRVSHVRGASGRRVSLARKARSTVVDPDGRPEDEIVRAVKQRMADTVELEVSHLENVQITCYEQMGYYIRHTDSLQEKGIDLGTSGDRLFTMVVYLNDDFRGGRTRFPRIGRSVRPERGKAALFRNLDTDGKAEPLALHQGTTVFSGQKWIINQLFREHPHRKQRNRASRRRAASARAQRRRP